MIFDSTLMFAILGQFNCDRFLIISIDIIDSISDWLTQNHLTIRYVWVDPFLDGYPKEAIASQGMTVPTITAVQSVCRLSSVKDLEIAYHWSLNHCNCA